MKKFTFDLQRFTATDVGTLDELTNAIKAGGDVEVNLTDDITLTEALDVSALTSLTITGTSKLIGTGTITGAKSLTYGGKTITSDTGVDVTLDDTGAISKVAVTNETDLGTAITQGITDVELKSDISLSNALNVGSLASLTIGGTGKLTGTINGAKNLTVGGKTVENTAGVNVTLDANNVSSITGLAAGGRVTYDNDNYINTGGFMASGDVVYGVNATTNILALPTTALFKIEGAKTDDLSKFTLEDTTVKVDEEAFDSQNITITKITGGADTTYALAIAGYTAPTYAWTGSGRNWAYTITNLYKVNDGQIDYTAEDTQVRINLTTAPTITAPATMNNAIGEWLTVDTDTKKITVHKVSGNLVENGFTITDGSYTIAALGDVGKFTLSGAAIDDTSAANGYLFVKGTWSKGYVRTDKSLTYKDAQADKQVAKISGLKAGVATGDVALVDAVAAVASDTTVDPPVAAVAAVPPLVKLKASALTSKGVSINEVTKAPDGTESGYELTLDTGVKTTNLASDQTNIWEVNSAQTAATYKKVQPAYYTLTPTEENGTYGKEIAYTAQNDVENYGTVSGLMKQNPDDIKTGETPTLVGGATLNLSYKKDDGTGTVDDVITAAVQSGEGAEGYDFTVKTNVLPTNGRAVTLTRGANGSTSKFVQGDLTAQTAETDPAPSWAFASNKATLSAKLTNGYTLTNDTTIQNSTATGNAVPIVEISNLGAFETDPAKISTYLTLEGTGNLGSDVAPTGGTKDGKITITLNKAALPTNGRVTVVSKTDSFKYELALAEDAEQEKETVDGEEVPKKYDVWQVNGTTAYYRQVIPAYYTKESDGSILYHKAEVVQTYATIGGLDGDVKASDDGTKLVKNFIPTGESEAKDVEIAKIATTADENGYKDITLYAEALKPVANGGTVTLNNGTGKYKLALATSDSAGATVAQAPDVTNKWWEVTTSGSTKTAQLYQLTQAGYSVDSTGLKINWTAATPTKKLLATVTGLSTDVTTLDKDGAATTADKGGVQLGIAESTAGAGDAEIAHTTYASTATGESGAITYTWKTGAALTNQDITLTKNMLTEAAVNLRDNVTNDSDTFKLVLSDASGKEPATATESITEWETTTSTAKLVNYNKAFYTLKNNYTQLAFTRDTTHRQLLLINGLGNPATGLNIDGTTIQKAGANPGDTATDYITLDDSDQTITISKDAIPTATDGAKTTLTINDKVNYGYYQMTMQAADAISYDVSSGALIWTPANDGSKITVTKESTAGGPEVSSDGKTITYHKATGDPPNTKYTANLFEISGLNLPTAPAAGAGTEETTAYNNKVTEIQTALASAFDSTSNTVTLPKSLLDSKNVTITPKDGEKYYLQLGADVSTAPEDGFGWQITTEGTGANETATVVGKKGKMEFYTPNAAGTAITYRGESMSTIFTIKGLKKDAVPTTITDKDGNEELNNAGATVVKPISFDFANKTVLIDTAALPNTDEDKVTLTGTGWKFDTGITEPVYADTTTAADWVVSGTDVILRRQATTAGWARSNNDQTLTYVDREVTPEGGTATPITRDFVKISGLDIPTAPTAPGEGATDEQTTAYNTALTAYNTKITAIKTALAAAYDTGSKTITLPKSVLGDKNVTIASQNGDKYILAVDSDVATTANGTSELKYAWKVTNGADDTKKNLEFQSVTQEYYTSNAAKTALTYHREQKRQTLFTLTGVNAELTASLTTADLAATDKDGDTYFNTADFTSYISVDTTNKKVSIENVDAVLPNGDGKNGAVVAINSSQYTFVNNFNEPVYGTGTWSDPTESGSLNSSTLTFQATTAGYKVSDDKKKLTYVGINDENGTAINHEFLTVTGVTSAPAATTYDDFTKTVTLPKTVLGNYNLSLKSENGETYKLKLDDETTNPDAPVLQQSTPGFAWNVTQAEGQTTGAETSTVVAKSVIREYYLKRNDTTYTHYAETPGTTLFTITGLKIGNATKATAGTADKDGDNVLNIDTNQYITFDTQTKVVTVDTTALPTTDGAEISLTGNGWKFDESNITTPTYDGYNTSWDITTATAPKVSINPSNAGFEYSAQKLIYRGASRELATLSGLTGELSADNLKNGVYVDVENKTLTLSNDVLKGTSRVTVNNNYKLALDESVRGTAPTNSDASNAWQISANGVAYYRTMLPEYYIASGNSVIHHDAVKKSGTSDIVAISGINGSVEINDYGDIVATGASTALVNINAEEKTVTVNPTAGNGGFAITTGGGTDGYKLVLENSEAVMGTPTFTYNNGTVTVKATYGAGYIVSADGQTITKITTGTGGNAEQTLATITGLKTGLNLTADDTKALFDFDSYSRKITFKDDTLIKGQSNVQITDEGNFFDYSLGIDSSLNPTSTAANKWVNNNGTLEYRNVTLANYTLENDNKKLIYHADANADTADTAILAKITGLKSGLTWAEGTSKNSFSIIDGGNVTTEDAVSIGTGDNIILKAAALPDGSTASSIELTNKADGTTTYKLKLDPYGEINTETTKSGFTWNQDNGATSATIKANITNSYVLVTTGDDANKKINYTPAKTAEVLATIKGLKAAGAAYNAVSLANASYDPVAGGVYVDNDTHEIKFKDSVLGTGKIEFDGTTEYTMALEDTQNTTATDAWSYGTGTAAGTASFTSKTPAYYEVADGNKSITHNAEAVAKTYFTISGLNSAGTINSTTVSFDGNDTVTISKAALPDPTARVSGRAPTVNVVIAKGTDNDADTTYKLALDSTMGNTRTETQSQIVTDPETGNETTQSVEVEVIGLAVEGTKALKKSANSAVTYYAPISKGYTLSATGNAITYADGTGTKDYFTISGLNLPTGTSAPANDAAWNDYLLQYITVGDDNTVTIKKDVLGSSAVTVSEGYTLALGTDVPTADTVSEDYNWSKSGNNYVYKKSMPEYYTLDTANNQITYTRATDGTTLATVTGLSSTADPNTIAVDEVGKTITLTSAHLGNSAVSFSNNSGGYKFLLGAGVSQTATENDETKWTVTKNGTTSSTAEYARTKGTPAVYTLNEAGTNVAYKAAAETKTSLIRITGLKNDLQQPTDTNAPTGITVTAPVTGTNGQVTTKGTITLAATALGTSGNIQLTANDYEFAELESGITSSESAASKGWTYEEKNGTPTFSYNRTAPYYELNTSTKKTITYHGVTNTPYVAISGAAENFNDTVKNAITTYHTAVDAEAALATDDAEESAKTEAATAKTNAYNALINAFKAYVPDATTSTTGATIGKSGETFLAASGQSLTVTTNGSYSVDLADGAASAPTGQTWSINGNSLVLTSNVGAGYTLKSTKANTYALGATSGDAQGVAAKELATINGLDLTEAKTKTDAELATYLNSRIKFDGNTIQIGKDLLGTSNVTITNAAGSDTTYKLAAGITTSGTLESGVYTSKTAAEAAANPEWTFSGGTATYKQTTPKYFVANAAGTTLTYNRAVAGATLATVRGLLNTKTEYGGTGASAYTDTTKVGVYTIDGKDVIGAEVTRKNAAGTETTSTTQGLTLVNGETTGTTDVKVNSAVLGTSNVTFTGSTNYKALTLDAAAPKVAMNSYAWTGSVNGTSAVLKGNYTKGYALNGNQITYTAARNNVNLATITGIKIDETKLTRTAYTALSDDDKKVAAKVTEANNTDIDAWLKTKITGATATQIQTNDKTTAIPFIIDKDLLNSNNVTIRSNDQRKYTIELGTGDAAPATEAAEAFKWNGFNYQQYKEGYYTDNTTTAKDTITYTRPTTAVTLATVRGLKSGVNLNNLATSFTTGASAFASAAGGGGTLTVSTDLLNNAKVSVATTTALTGTFTIALDTAAVNTDPDATYETAWTVNGTTATKTSGAKQAYYTADANKNEINYTAATQVKTLATLRGINSTVTAANGWSENVTETKNTITLNKAALGTTNITLAKGNGDTLTYELELDSAIKPSSILKEESDFTTAKNEERFGVAYDASLKPAWVTQGVNTTLKGSVSDGWAISANGLTAQHTASATNKALATFAFDKAGIATETAVALSNGTIELGSLGENKRLTVRTNPDALKLKFTDFNGTAAGETAAVNNSVIGSASADSFEFDHSSSLNNIVVSGAAGDDEIKMVDAISVASIGGGAGNDTISMAGAASNVTIYGDADNDEINVASTATNTNNIIYGGVGNDKITIGAAATKAAGTIKVYGDAGKDTIDVTANTTTITIIGGADDDNIKVTGDLAAVTVSGDAGNDEINIIGAAAATTVNAGAGNDVITITGAVSGAARIWGDAGDDKISLASTFGGTAAALATLNAGVGNDSITIGGAVSNANILLEAGNDIFNVTVDGVTGSTVNVGAGDDTINITGNVTSARIWGDAGKDTIGITGDFKGTTAALSTLNAGADNDTVTIGGDVDYATIGVEAGDDKVTIGGNVSNATINAGVGNDSITIGTAGTDTVQEVRIVGDAGNDDIYIKGSARNLTLSAGAGLDTLKIVGALTANATGATIGGDAGNDYIEIGDSVTGANEKIITINGGADNDTIWAKNDVSYAKIMGEAGNDSILGGAATNATILAGIGNDTINMTGNASNVTVFGDAGNDVITVGGTATNVTINGGAGNDTIKIAGAATAPVSIFGDAGNDSIEIASGGGIFNGGAGNDTISIGGAASAVSIFGEAGDDRIYFTNGSGTINGGAGNDTINIADGTNISVFGDAGNDVITFTAGTGTVFGGAGNDTIDLASSGAVHFYYENGNGNDVVKNFSIGTDIFNLKDGETIGAASVTGGSNLILTIGSGKVTLQGAYSSGTEFNYTSGTDSSKKVAIQGATASSPDLAEDISDLIYTDNNLMTPGDISDLISTNSVTEYHVGNYNNNIMAPDQILSEGDLISYGDQQKKNNK